MPVRMLDWHVHYRIIPFCSLIHMRFNFYTPFQCLHYLYSSKTCSFNCDKKKLVAITKDHKSTTLINNYIFVNTPTLIMFIHTSIYKIFLLSNTLFMTMSKSIISMTLPKIPYDYIKNYIT